MLLLLLFSIAKLDGFRRKKDDLKKSVVPDDIDEEEDDPYGEKEADMRLGKKRVRIQFSVCGGLYQYLLI